MGRRPREYHDGWVYHLTARGIGERPVFADDLDRQGFAIRLRRAALLEGWRLHAVCLMGTHYHLLVQGGGDRIPRGMRVLNGGYARAYNARHSRRGSLFESRYEETPIRDEEHLGATVRYIEANPVRAGIVGSVDEWPWSTHSSSPLRALLERCLTP